MTQTYHFDHLHLVSRDPKAAALYYQKMFDAKIIESIEPDGKPRIDLNINGLVIFIFPVGSKEDLPDSPIGRYVGLDHFGFRVDNLDETVTELKRRGVEPFMRRPGLKSAFVRAPENVRIEILERS
jgi:catechol 2,3-dioxygenase-like lactoylglutathione lyase family enzyme